MWNSEFWLNKVDLTHKKFLKTQQNVMSTTFSQKIDSSAILKIL